MDIGASVHGLWAIANAWARQMVGEPEPAQCNAIPLTIDEQNPYDQSDPRLTQIFEERDNVRPLRS